MLDRRQWKRVALAAAVALAACRSSPPPLKHLTDEEIIANKPAGTNAIIVHGIGYGRAAIGIAGASPTCEDLEFESSHYSQTCWAYVPVTTPSITVSVAPVGGGVFLGWGAAPCSATTASTCELPMDVDRIIGVKVDPGGAAPAASEHRLTVRVLGFVDGDVTAVASPPPPGGAVLACLPFDPGDRVSFRQQCLATFPAGTVVTLTPSPRPGTTFAGWGGACSGTGSCTVTMNADRTVTAGFVACGGATSCVAWTPGGLDLPAIPGTRQVTTASFVSQVPLANVDLVPSPELASLLILPVSHLDAVEPGVTYEIPVVVDVSPSASPGTYSGPVDGPGVPLLVTVRVAYPPAGSVPPDIVTASPSRITVDPSGIPLVVDELLVSLVWDTPDPERRIWEIAAAVGGRVIGSVPELLMYQVTVPVADLAGLAAVRAAVEAMPDVASAPYDWMSGASAAVPNDTLYGTDLTNLVADGSAWNLVMIGAPAAWDLTTGSRTVAAAVIELGRIDGGHGDLAPNVTSVSGNQPVSFWNWAWREAAHSIWDGARPGEHGTHVAGTVCAKGNNGKGVTGVAWDCDLRLYQVIDKTAGRAAWAMTRAAREGAKVVNMSFGFAPPAPRSNGVCVNQPLTSDEFRVVADVSTLLTRPIEFARRPINGLDVLWVLAAGNDCRDARQDAPASLAERFPNVITVASVDATGAKSSFSNYGPAVSVAAPGGASGARHILGAFVRPCNAITGHCSESETPGSSAYAYGELSGTSMAAPQVAGIAALVRSAHPTFTADQVKACIVNAANARADAVPGHLFKLVDAAGAVRCDSAGRVTFTRLTTDPSRDVAPIWRSSGELLFQSNRGNARTNTNDVWRMNTDGTTQQKLVQVNVTTPISWGDPGLGNPIELLGATGDLVVYEAQTYHEIMRVRLSQATALPIVRTVQDGPDTYFSRLLFVPGGQSASNLAYDASTGMAAWVAHTPYGHRLRTAAFTSLSGQSTDSYGTLLASVGTTGMIHSISYSPDGKRLAVAMSQTYSSAVRPDIYVLDASNGAVLQRVTTSGESGTDNQFPRWSPRGDRLAFQAFKDGQWSVWTASPTSTPAPTRLVTPVQAYWPAWSPDGASLAFVGIGTDGNEDIWIARNVAP